MDYGIKAKSIKIRHDPPSNLLPPNNLSPCVRGRKRGRYRQVGR